MSDLVNIETDYEYVLGIVAGNVLDLQAVFENGSWTKPELEKIRDELIEAGHTFASAQGLGGTRLDSHINATVDGNKVRFTNDAQDDYLNFYAGHVEYGHRTRNGTGFVDARPFMRPAMYAVADATRGNLQGTVSRYLNSMWAATPMRFGHQFTASGYERKFYQERQYMNVNAGKSNILPRQNVDRIRGVNSAKYSVHRDKSTAYSRSIMSSFGWK